MKINMRLVVIVGLILIGFAFVSAVPPVQTTVVAQQGLEIEATNSLYLPQNEDHTFHFRVYNASTNIYISPDDVTCSMGIIDNNGNYIIQVPDVSNVSYRFDVLVLGGNFSENSIYHKGINCLLDDGTAGAVLTQSFEITKNGQALTTPNAILNLGFILLMIILFIITVIGMLMIPSKSEVKEDGEIISRGWVTYLKPVLFATAYSLLMATIFLASGVATQYLFFDTFGDMLFKVYQIMMRLLLPIIIVWFIWIFVSIFQDKEMKKMIERGGDDFGSI